MKGYDDTQSKVVWKGTTRENLWTPELVSLQLHQIIFLLSVSYNLHIIGYKII